MALSAPIPIIEGSQTEFSKVWIRGSTATSTLPNLRFYKADGRIVHPIAAALNITIVHTAADTLYNRIQAAITAADATKTAAWVAKWFGKHQIVGVTSDAITGDTLLVNRAETTGITASNDEPTARVAADFFAQEQYAVGTMFRHGILPGDQSGLNAATVNVSGEVETSGRYKFVNGTSTLAAIGEAATLTCEGYGTAMFLMTDLGTGTAGLYNFQVSADNSVWYNARSHYIVSSGTTAASNTASSPSTFAVGTRVYVECHGAKYVRANWGSGGTTTTGQVIRTQLTTAPYTPAGPMITALGTVPVSGSVAHDAAVSGNPVLVGVEARATDPTAVASGDLVRIIATLLGKSIVLPYAIPASTWRTSAATGGITSATTTAAKAAPGVSGTRHYITSFQVLNMSSTASEVAIQSASTDVWRAEFDADGGASGISVTLPAPIRCGDNEAINIVTTGAGKVFVNIQGYTGAE